MSYHDQPPPSLKFGDDSKKNYYDELNFWLSRSKNLETLLIEAIGHIEDFELMMRMVRDCLLYTSPSPRDKRQSRMPSSA